MKKLRVGQLVRIKKAFDSFKKGELCKVFYVREKRPSLSNFDTLIEIQEPRSLAGWTPSGSDVYNYGCSRNKKYYWVAQELRLTSTGSFRLDNE